MIFEPLHPHSAEYDLNGNIILPGGGDDPIVWSMSDEPTGGGASGLSRAKRNRPRDIQRRARVQFAYITRGMVSEGVLQYRTVLDDLRSLRESAGDQLGHLRDRMWSVLTQPVWVQNRRTKKVKEYRRGTLFFLDAFRFGATFAVLFGLLFVTLNYQSFWQITQSAMSPIRQAQAGAQSQVGLEAVAGAITDGSGNAPRAGDLLSFLPTVGPPENRIVIPRLNLNIPLVTPPYTALLEEDWEKLEEDIQASLEHGVVHYPGTAKPGQAGNFFVTGHSSYYPWAPGKYKTVFARLHDLQIGDEYFVYFGGDKHRYIIRDKKEVKPTNVRVLDQPTDQRIATLMTCTPVGTTLRRLILVAEEVDPSTGIALSVGEQQTRTLPTIQTEMLPI